METGKWKEWKEKIEVIIKEERGKRVLIEEDVEVMKVCWEESERREIGRCQEWKEMKEEIQILKGQLQGVKKELEIEKKEREKLERKLEEVGAREESDEGGPKGEKQGRKASGVENNKEELEIETLKKSGLIIRRGSRWGERGSLGSWMEKELGNREWEIRNLKTREDMKIIVLKKEEDREKLWRKSEELRTKRIAVIDEWLADEERVARFGLLEEAKRMEMKAIEGGIPIKIKKENRRLIVNEVEFIWDYEEGKVRRKEEKKKEVMEDRRREQRNEKRIQEMQEGKEESEWGKKGEGCKK